MPHVTKEETPLIEGFLFYRYVIARVIANFIDMIRVNIRCFSRNNSIPEELMGDIEPEEEFREGDIMISNIQGVYRFGEGKHTMIECLSVNYIVEETVDEVRRLVRVARINNAFIVYNPSEN